jgi:hypothetical protein
MDLDLGSPSVRLRRARAADVPAIIGLLADDPLGAGRDGLRTAADLAAYKQAFASPRRRGAGIARLRRRDEAACVAGMRPLASPG